MSEPEGPSSRLALGLMSGTSIDGIDVALLATDGRARIEPGPAISVPYETKLRDAIRSILGGDGPVAEIERELTLAHADAVRRLLTKSAIDPGAVRVIGFHGHTILHRPAERRTWQIGDGALLAAETGIDVVCDMRQADIAAGGQGAPLAPLFHRALCDGLDRPIAVLNIGGVANVTWIGAEADDVLAFDTGPGNALIDEWTAEKTGEAMDRDGALALSGQVDDTALARLLDDPYFAAPPPKSLDRLDFDRSAVNGLSAADGAATLVAFTCRAVASAAALLPAPPKRWLVTGGGRHNPAIMASLAACLGRVVEPVEAIDCDGDALEAYAFAFLAVRSLDGLPLTVPGTTGVGAPLTGGTLYRAPAREKG